MDKEDFIEEVYNVLIQDLDWLSDIGLTGDQVQDVLSECSNLIYYYSHKK